MIQSSFKDTTNVVLAIESETTDHFLLKELFNDVEEYGVVVDSIDNKFCSFGIKLARDLKEVVQQLTSSVNILVKSQAGMYDTYKIRRSRDSKVAFAIANKLQLPFSLWCNTRGEITRETFYLGKINAYGIPISNMFLELERYAALSCSLPLFSDYCFMKREKHFRGKFLPAIQHSKAKCSDIVFILMCKILQAQQDNYLTAIKSIRFVPHDVENTFYVEWGIQQSAHERISFFFGSRLRGSIYKPFVKYRFSVDMFKKEFTLAKVNYHENLIKELYLS